MPYNPYYYNPYQYQQPQQPQTFTPPTIHAEIVQVDDMTAASNYPVGAGQSQMMIARDDSAIFIKSAAANGQTSLAVYRREKEQPKPEINLSNYITREEFEQRLSTINFNVSRETIGGINNEPVRATGRKQTTESNAAAQS